MLQKESFLISFFIVVFWQYSKSLNNIMSHLFYLLLIFDHKEAYYIISLYIPVYL